MTKIHEYLTNKVQDLSGRTRQALRESQWEGRLDGQERENVEKKKDGNSHGRFRRSY